MGYNEMKYEYGDSPVNLAKRIVSEKCFFGDEMARKDFPRNGHLNDKTPRTQCWPRVSSHLETKYWKALQVEINLIERLYAG